MGQRGKAAANVHLLPGTEKPRIKPPIGTDKEFKKRWRFIVNDWPGDYFKKTDIKLLSNYIRTEIMIDEIDKQFTEQERQYLIDDEVNKLIKLHESLSRVLLSYSIKLRICPSCRDRVIRHGKLKEQNTPTNKRPMYKPG